MVIAFAFVENVHVEADAFIRMMNLDYVALQILTYIMNAFADALALARLFVPLQALLAPLVLPIVFNQLLLYRVPFF